jgi:hypothetical protein
MGGACHQITSPTYFSKLHLLPFTQLLSFGTFIYGAIYIESTLSLVLWREGFL